MPSDLSMVVCGGVWQLVFVFLLSWSCGICNWALALGGSCWRFTAQGGVLHSALRTNNEKALRSKSILLSVAGGAGSGGWGFADKLIDGAADGGKDCGRLA
jgi:hypothetical protein